MQNKRKHKYVAIATHNLEEIELLSGKLKKELEKMGLSYRRVDHSIDFLKGLCDRDNIPGPYMLLYRENGNKFTAMSYRVFGNKSEYYLNTHKIKNVYNYRLQPPNFSYKSKKLLP